MVQHKQVQRFFNPADLEIKKITKKFKKLLQKVVADLSFFIISIALIKTGCGVQ